MYEAPLEAFKDVPKAESCRLMDVDQVAIITRESSPPQEILAVSGTTPSRTMAVDRVPRVYLQPPDSWGIAGIGALPGIGLPAPAPDAACIWLSGMTGTQGLEVIGAPRMERRAVPPPQGPQAGCGAWEAWLDRQPLGTPLRQVRGACEFPSAGDAVAWRRHAPQGLTPNVLRLDTRMRAPTERSAMVRTMVPVRSREQTAVGSETVTILPDGISLTVREVS